MSNLWGMHRANRRAVGGQRGPAGAEEVTLTPGQPCYLRLSSLQPELTQVLTERLLPALPETITLAGATLRVASVASTAEEHPWAGRASYPALVQEHTLSQAPAPGLALRFGSPTVFKSQEQFVPLPLPKLVFESLARRWNAFAPLNLPEEVSRFAGETMAISRYQLRTERMVFGADADRRDTARLRRHRGLQLSQQRPRLDGPDPPAGRLRALRRRRPAGGHGPGPGQTAVSAPPAGHDNKPQQGAWP